MTAHASCQRLSLDPLMAEAKRRARQRRVLVSAAGLVAVVVGLGLFFVIGGGANAGSGQDGGTARPGAAGRSSVSRAQSVTIRPAHFVINGFGGIRKPPGGAELRKKHRLLLQRTVVGPAAIWVAPDWAVRGNCAWLTIKRAVYGGECRRSEPPRRGLSEVVPLHLQVNGRFLTLLWGHVGPDVSSLEVQFGDGTSARLPLTAGVFFRVFPRQRWLVGHRPVWLVARENDGHTLRERLISKFR